MPQSLLTDQLKEKPTYSSMMLPIKKCTVCVQQRHTGAGAGREAAGRGHAHHLPTQEGHQGQEIREEQLSYSFILRPHIALD
jgi:hypothetical protein